MRPAFIFFVKLAEHYTHSGEVQQTLTICMDYVTEKS